MNAGRNANVKVNVVFIRPGNEVHHRCRSMTLAAILRLHAEVADEDSRIDGVNLHMSILGLAHSHMRRRKVLRPIGEVKALRQRLERSNRLEMIGFHELVYPSGFRVYQRCVHGSFLRAGE